MIGDAPGAFRSAGEAYGRPARSAQLTALPEGKVPRRVVFDASELAEPAALRALYEHFHALAPRLAASGRVVVIGRPAKPAVAATQAALEGFVRSLAKEVGKRGATAQLLFVDEGAEARGAEVLRFLLSQRSAFVSGQPLHVTTTAVGRRRPWPFGPARPLEGKVALVTGAARGIGEATARLLAAEGAHVLCLDRPGDDELVAEVARDIGGTPCSSTSPIPTPPEAIADALKHAHGGVDIVVHNAGVTRDKTIGKMSAELWEQAVDINLGAVTRITAALLPDVLRDGGRVVCLSSVAGIAGNVGQTNYAASKSGIIGYVRALAPTLAARGITVNAIAPGFIETRLTAAIPVVIREVGRRLSSARPGRPPRGHRRGDHLPVPARRGGHDRADPPRVRRRPDRSLR